MTNHNNIYNILGKLNAISPQEKPSQKESILKQLRESADAPIKDIATRLNERYMAEKEMGEDMLAKKDYDGDGKKETGKDEYMGSRDKAIKKAKQDLVDEGEYQDSVDKSKIPAFQRKAKGGDDWKLSTQDLDDEATKSPTSSAGLARRKQELGMSEGFPTVDDAKARAEQERGTGKFDKQITSTGTRYTRKSDTYANDSGEETTTSDAPKKRGRPAKAKGPERTTSKAWKHKGSRVSERNINLKTVVEDTLAEMDDLLVMEKAVSKQQQKYFGLVSALQTGKKVPGASSDARKTARDMSRSDVHDFASTKHQGLPDTVSEGITFESANSDLNAICHRYSREVKDFMTSGDMHDNLYDALYDYYFDDMPYGVKKARDGDPYEWVADRFYDDMGGDKYDGGEDALSPIPPSISLDKHDHELNELAKLAGLEESSCNMTAEGEYCPEHGLAECGGMMYEGKKIDQDGDGDNDFDDVKIARMKASGMSGKAAKEKVDEMCGMPGMEMAQPEEESGMNVSTSFDTKSGRKSINISAQGETAEQIAQILKMAGLVAHEVAHGHEGHEHPTGAVIHVAEEFANEPDEAYYDQEVITDQGNDLNKKKKQDPTTANKSANPLKENEITDRLTRMYTKFKQ
jgi:hypothetical protein